MNSFRVVFFAQECDSLNRILDKSLLFVVLNNVVLFFISLVHFDGLICCHEDFRHPVDVNRKAAILTFPRIIRDQRFLGEDTANLTILTQDGAQHRTELRRVGASLAITVKMPLVSQDQAPGDSADVGLDVLIDDLLTWKISKTNLTCLPNGLPKLENM